MRRKITILLFLLSSCFVFSQNTIIDSLKIQFKVSKQDTLKAEILSDLAYYYLYESIDSSLLYSKKLELFSDKIQSKKFKFLANKSIGSAFMHSNKYDSAHFYFKLATQVADMAALNKSAIYTNLGILYKREEKYAKALEVYFEGLKYDEAKNDNYGKFIKLLNISNLYSTIKDSDNYIKYSKRAFLISKKTTNKKIQFAIGTLLNNLGIHYFKLKNYEKALHYFNESLKYNLKFDNKKEIARNYNNIGSVYTNIEDQNKAIFFLKKALQIRNKLGDKIELVETNMALGTVFGKKRLEKKSNYHFNIALNIAKKLKNLALVSETYLAISNNYSQLKQSKKAFNNYKKYIIYEDSILKKENKKNINEFAIKYETEKKDKEIIQQQLQLEKTENELQKKKIQNGFMTGISIFLLVASIFSWFLFKQRQKRKNQELITIKRETQIRSLESLIQGEEKERLRIAKELHDGVNGDLSAIKHKLNTLLQLNNKTIEEAVVMIDKSCEQVRAISHNLVPPALENFDLKSAIADFCTNKNNIHKPKIKFNYLGDDIKLAKIAEINIFRIVQELVNNSIKHAEATKINVQFSVRNNDIQLAVEDNGKGFNAYDVKNDGIGISNVKSRVAFLNGEIDFESNKEGTSVNIFMDKTRFNDD